jgi:hypothetical protein
MKVSQHRGVAGGGKAQAQGDVRNGDREAFRSELSRNGGAREAVRKPTASVGDAPSRRPPREGGDPSVKPETGARSEAARDGAPRDEVASHSVTELLAAEGLTGDVDAAALAASPVGRTAIGVAIAEIASGLDGPAAEASVGLLRKTLALMDYVDERRSDEVRRPSRFRSEPL